MAITAIYAKQALAGKNLEPLRDACVVVEDQRIRQITTKTAFKTSGMQPDREIDLGERTIMPGMIECHAHLALDARIPNHLDMMNRSECEHTLLALNGLKDDLMSGVTTARSLGDRNYIDVVLRDKIKEEKVIGPDLLVCGIGMKGLHGHGYVGLSHSGVEEFRRTARENMFRGVDVLKIFVTPGKPAFNRDEFIPCYITLDEIRTVVEEARALNIKTAAHCIGGKGLEYCVKAGIDCIEHVYSITPEEVQMVEEEHKGWIDLTSGIVLDPDREPFLSESHKHNMQMGRAYTTECVSRVYTSDKIRWTLGTDANHGLLYKEVGIAVRCGADPLRAVQGVTSNAALMLGIAERTGQLAEGLNADIIAVDENPVENVATLQNVHFVMKRGKVYKSE